MVPDSYGCSLLQSPFFVLIPAKKQELIFFNNKNSRFGAVLGGVFAFCGLGVAKKSSNAFLLEK